MHPETAAPATPTIGRIVLFRGSAPLTDAREHPAVITRVWSDTLVNLLVFWDKNAPGAVTSARYDPDGADQTWRWPPRA